MAVYDDEEFFMKSGQVQPVGTVCLCVAACGFYIALAHGQQGRKSQPPAETEPLTGKDLYIQPVAEHKNLDPLVGSWEVTGQCWAMGESSSVSVTGADESQWVLGNRFVHHQVKGMKADKAFEGMGMSGYDTVRKEYQAVWQDTESTAIRMEKGTYEPSTRSFTFTGEFQDEKGQTLQCRRVLELHTDDHYIMTTYVVQGDMPEVKVAELIFTRAGTQPVPDR